MQYLLAVVLLLLAPLMSAASSARAEPSVQVAVAADFADPLRDLIALYSSGHPQSRIHITMASTGKLAAQIRQGAPYDLFLAADARRPRELEQEKLIVAGSRRTYALGRLALWSAQTGLDLGPELLESGKLTPLALANPRTAPYGAAAMAVLDGLSIPDSVRLVQGENVAQAFQFASSGAVHAAFVAFSQVRDSGGSLWLPQARRYPPIVQQGVLLTAQPEAREFYRFLFSAEARDLIQNEGYGVPE